MKPFCQPSNFDLLHEEDSRGLSARGEYHRNEPEAAYEPRIKPESGREREGERVGDLLSVLDSHLKVVSVLIPRIEQI